MDQTMVMGRGVLSEDRSNRRVHLEEDNLDEMPAWQVR